MRLSATDRIIREAAQHDDAAVEAADHPDTEKVSAAPFVALGIPAPRMPTPLNGGVDIDLDSDDGHDDEGETQVDAQRSAAALKEMRALQPAHHTPAPNLTGRADQVRQRGVPPGRPAGIALTPAPVPAASPTTTLIFGSPGPGAAPAGRSSAAVVRAFAPPPPDVQVDIDVDDDRPDQLFSSSRIPLGADPQPPGDVAASGTSWPSHRTGRVSRRTGVAIAASTALAVALIAGAWTTKKPVPESAAMPAPPPVLPSSLRPGDNAPTPPRPNGPVVVATAPPPAPAAQAAPEPAEAPPSPAVPEELAPTADQAAAHAPLPATAPAPPAPLSKRAQAAAASAAKKAALKARVAKKRAALAAASAKRRARAHKSSKAVATSAAPSRPTASRSADTSRGRGDPDDTLPITD